MNMYALQGHKVIVTEESAKSGYKSSFDHVAKLLEINKEYTVASTTVHDWHSTVVLEEFPNEIFDTVNFRDVVAQHEDLDIKHPDYDRYN